MMAGRSFREVLEFCFLFKISDRQILERSVQSGKVKIMAEVMTWPHEASFVDFTSH